MDRGLPARAVAIVADRRTIVVQQGQTSLVVGEGSA